MTNWLLHTRWRVSDASERRAGSSNGTTGQPHRLVPATCDRLLLLLLRGRGAGLSGQTDGLFVSASLQGTGARTMGLSHWSVGLDAQLHGATHARFVECELACRTCVGALLAPSDSRLIAQRRRAACPGCALRELLDAACPSVLACCTALPLPIADAMSPRLLSRRRYSSGSLRSLLRALQRRPTQPRSQPSIRLVVPPLLNSRRRLEPILGPDSIKQLRVLRRHVLDLRELRSNSGRSEAHAHLAVDVVDHHGLGVRLVPPRQGPVEGCECVEG